MSTKASVFYGDSFHLYEECCDNEAIYLEGSDWDASLVNSEGKSTVTVRIPLSVWETIRNYSQMDALCNMAGRDDDEIKSMVEAHVKERMEMIAATGCGHASGFLVYGPADEPIETQIEKGIAHYKQERQRTQNLLDEIDKLLAAKRRE